MSARQPSRANGPKRPAKTGSNTAKNHTPMDRSYAQKVRPDRREKGVSYESKTKRAQFWAHIQSQQAAAVAQSVSMFSSMPPLASVSVASANIHSATLDSAPPAMPGTGISVAGLDSQGFAPPPPAPA